MANLVKYYGLWIFQNLSWENIVTLFSEWIYCPFQIAGLSSSSGEEAWCSAESESGKTNQILKDQGQWGRVRLMFSVVASSYTFSYFSKQRWVTCNFSIEMPLGFYSHILISLHSSLCYSSYKYCTCHCRSWMLFILINLDDCLLNSFVLEVF